MTAKTRRVVLIAAEDLLCFILELRKLYPEFENALGHLRPGILLHIGAPEATANA
jgi:hypothetical protein